MPMSVTGRPVLKGDSIKLKQILRRTLPAIIHREPLPMNYSGDALGGASCSLNFPKVSELSGSFIHSLPQVTLLPDGWEFHSALESLKETRGKLFRATIIIVSFLSFNTSISLTSPFTTNPELLFEEVKFPLPFPISISPKLAS